MEIDTVLQLEKTPNPIYFFQDQTLRKIVVGS